MIGTVLLHMIFSFISTITFAVLCNVPKKSIIPGGIIGMIGWMGFWGLSSNGVGIFVSSFVCALLLAFSSQVAATLFKKPMTVYFVPGLVPVVPGITFYNGFRDLLLKEYKESVFVFLDVAYSAVGIVCGLVVSAIIFRFLVVPAIARKRRSQF
ncbi:threonine/serine exporter family protein [Bacillus sp. 1P06AnD]|uniref:threonine/serine exporter family protein n=1 Tax=Bacillus sp. 1P06AnD TaxID=3132208 RepID=UPI00399FFB51